MAITFTLEQPGGCPCSSTGLPEAQAIDPQGDFGCDPLCEPRCLKVEWSCTVDSSGNSSWYYSNVSCLDSSDTDYSSCFNGSGDPITDLTCVSDISATTLVGDGCTGEAGEDLNALANAEQDPSEWNPACDPSCGGCCLQATWNCYVNMGFVEWLLDETSVKCTPNGDCPTTVTTTCSDDEFTLKKPSGCACDTSGLSEAQAINPEDDYACVPDCGGCCLQATWNCTYDNNVVSWTLDEGSVSCVDNSECTGPPTTCTADQFILKKTDGCACGTSGLPEAQAIDPEDDYSCDPLCCELDACPDLEGYFRNHYSSTTIITIGTCAGTSGCYDVSIRACTADPNAAEGTVMVSLDQFGNSCICPTIASDILNCYPLCGFQNGTILPLELFSINGAGFGKTYGMDGSIEYTWTGQQKNNGCCGYDANCNTAPSFTVEADNFFCGIDLYTKETLKSPGDCPDCYSCDECPCESDETSGFAITALANVYPCSFDATSPYCSSASIDWYRYPSLLPCAAYHVEGCTLSISSSTEPDTTATAYYGPTTIDTQCVFFINAFAGYTYTITGTVSIVPDNDGLCVTSSCAVYPANCCFPFTLPVPGNLPVDCSYVILDGYYDNITISPWSCGDPPPQELAFQLHLDLPDICHNIIMNYDVEVKDCTDASYSTVYSETNVLLHGLVSQVIPASSYLPKYGQDIKISMNFVPLVFCAAGTEFVCNTGPCPTTIVFSNYVENCPGASATIDVEVTACPGPQAPTCNKGGLLEVLYGCCSFTNVLVVAGSGPVTVTLSCVDDHNEIFAFFTPDFDCCVSSSFNSITEP